MAAFMKKYIPSHLMCEYHIYAKLITGSHLISEIIEECIKEGLLLEPESKMCAEGILMIVER